MMKDANTWVRGWNWRQGYGDDVVLRKNHDLFCRFCTIDLTADSMKNAVLKGVKWRCNTKIEEQQ